jgi:ureidoglycolate hydrolase
MEKVDSICKDFIKQIKKRIPMNPLTDDELNEFDAAAHCHICTELLHGDKVRDHDPRTGIYRGAAHRQCNAKYFPVERIPIIIHNFKNYDCHLLLHGMKKFPEGKVTAIPMNSETFLSIVCRNFVFLDSMMFLSASLAESVKNCWERIFKTNISQKSLVSWSKRLEQS